MKKGGSLPAQETSPQAIMKKSEEKQSTDLEREIEKLKAELDGRRASLPMHDATPQQWIALEELEDKIAQKKNILRELK